MPESIDEHIVSVADRISAGADRTKSEIESEISEKFYEQPLKSIFSNINLSERERAEEYYYSLGKLEPETVLPLSKKSRPLVNAEKYGELWNCFENDFCQLGRVPVPQFILSLDALLKNYTWCIPSTTIDEPDISLYDHLITTAAIASVLYRYHEEEGTFSEDEIKRYDLKKFLFVTGDLSGIQDYLFDLKSTKYNAKHLRARSFELQLISDAVASKILEMGGLPHMCKIMDAGGRFLLLLPNTPQMKKNIETARIETERYFLERYFGELALNISHGVELSPAEITISDHVNENKKPKSEPLRRSDLFFLISNDASESKQRRFQAILLKHSHILEHEYIKIKGSENLCRCCEKRAIQNDELCNVCINLRDLGGNIPKSSIIALYDSEISEANTFMTYPSTYVALFNEAQKAQELLPLAKKVFFINRYEPGYSIINTPFYVPVNNEGEVKTFEDISKEQEPCGANKLAMLKADVDNLGGIFSFGIGEKISISRYASLSRMLNYFFSGCIHHVVRNNVEFRNIYIVYSGGDDLCIIGPWTAIIKFSIRIHELFEKYVGFNPSLTISGGITLFDHNTPVKYTASRADSLLDISKNEKEKNKITIFGNTVSWYLYGKLIELGEQFFQKIKENQFSSGLMHRILNYGKRKREFESGKLIYNNALWHSHFLYDASRNIKDTKTREWLIKEVAENIDNIGIALSYALYKARKTEVK